MDLEHNEGLPPIPPASQAQSGLRTEGDPGVHGRSLTATHDARTTRSGGAGVVGRVSP